MPKGPQGLKRPADVIGNAIHVMRIATGEIDDLITDDGKNAAAVALGRMGGKARAEGMSAKRRKEIAKKAAKSRWPRGSPCEQPLVKRLASPGIFNTFQKSGNCKKGGTGQMGRRELAVHDKRAIKISVKSVTNVVAFFRSCGDQRKRISKQP